MNQTKTPKTDYNEFHPDGDGGCVGSWFARQLERELTSVTEQRDRLAESLRKFVGDALSCQHADTATDVSAPQQVDDSGDALTMPYTNKHE